VQPGDILIVRAGTYHEALRTLRGGQKGRPIIVRGERGGGAVIVAASGRALTIDHPFIVFDGLVFDGGYGSDDTLLLSDRASHVIIRNSEVRRSSRDLIDIRSPQHVLLENCLIHHALNAADGRTDAHGIAVGASRDLVIRNTEIHTFSGDGIQIDPGRTPPGWDRVVVEGARIWLAPMSRAENGFGAGVVPGENAIDTKAAGDLPRASLTIRDTEASGFGGGLIGNMAAFNLKENVRVTVEGVTVRNSEIAFRLRGPTGQPAAGAQVTVKNAVIHDVKTAFRYENDLEALRVWNTTIGSGVREGFQAASSPQTVFDLRNVLMLGKALPPSVSHVFNRTVGPEAFVNAGGHRYELAPGSTAIDAGTVVAEVATDRAGVRRPQGKAYDIGAYEARK
jgi:Right handed beta helix region